MPISFVASTRSPTAYPGTTSSDSNNTSTCILAKPAGTIEGDVVVVYLESGGASNFSYPAGWREVAKYENTAANMTSGIAYKVMTGTEGTSYTFGDSQGGATPLCGLALTYRGVDITDPTTDPVNARGESNTGTTGTSAVAAPTVTSTAVGWYVWFRAGKISTTNPSENSFTVSGGTARQGTSNRGGSTGYFAGSADSNGTKSIGSNAGATFTRTGSGTFSGSIARTIVLKQATPPTAGDLTATLGGVTATSTGTVHDDATMSVTLPKISVQADGEHFPPAVGSMAVQLAPVTETFSGTATGGSFAVTLWPVSTALAGAVNPIGTFGLSLPFIELEIGSETRVFGENVILVEQEKRALRITQDDTIPIYKRDVGFEEIASPFSLELAPVQVSFAAETTSGELVLNLAPVGADWSGQIINGSFTAQLSPVTAQFTGGIIGGSFGVNLGRVSMGSWIGNHEASGDLAAQLGGISMSFTDSPAGPFSMSLEPVDAEFGGAIIVGDFDGVQLSPVEVEFNGLVTTEDVLKYAADIGDGSNTSYTVTHSANTRDVVVSVFDNSTYEEVVPLTVHATTNTITLQFASAPSSNAYRVVVLYSSV